MKLFASKQNLLVLPDEAKEKRTKEGILLPTLLNPTVKSGVVVDVGADCTQYYNEGARVYYLSGVEIELDGIKYVSVSPDYIVAFSNEEV